MGELALDRSWALVVIRRRAAPTDVLRAGRGTSSNGFDRFLIVFNGLLIGFP